MMLLTVGLEQPNFLEMELIFDPLQYSSAILSATDFDLIAPREVP